MSEAVDKWKNEIVRNSEILQSHREEIDDMRKDIDLLLEQGIIKNSVEGLQETTLNKIILDRMKKGFEIKRNEFNHLKKLFEKLININDQAFACGAMTAREYSRVTKVRKEYQELMEG